ncbi:coiled-coil domain-containing protein 137-like [Liolophura sinensis]|uniref:coiled-coil domain-containing protein 137-like n=1 Tax=Liolophura sinensis TaxID=3198878 RepID=UPI003158D824
MRRRTTGSVSHVAKFVCKCKMGRIGKPQKTQKNKKIKSVDPFYIGDRKDSRTKHKDQRPANDDHQEMPRKVRRLMDSVLDVRNLSSKKRNRKRHFVEQNYVHPGMTKPMEAVPKFKKRNNESDYKFMSRVERETQAVLQQSKLEDKFKVKFERNAKGEIVVQKKGPSKRKKQRMKERKQKKKEQKQEKSIEKKLEFDALTDKVQFGEIVSQPPVLTAKPWKSQTLGHTKPGQRSLLLKEIMSDQLGSTSSTKRKIGETVKRKHLTPAQQVVTDLERQNAIDMYRHLKGKKQKLSDT